MASNKIIIKDKYEAFDKMEKVKRDLREIRADEFGIVIPTELSAFKGIIFNIEHEERLRELGVLNECPYHQHVAFRTKDRQVGVNNRLYAADKLLTDILNFLQNCHITPKRHFSDLEMSMFTLVKGGNQDTALVSQLKGGADYA